eukprot:5163854-Pleurochrysis_carterae.AAC.3
MVRKSVGATSIPTTCSGNMIFKSEKSMFATTTPRMHSKLHTASRLDHARCPTLLISNWKRKLRQIWNTVSRLRAAARAYAADRTGW